MTITAKIIADSMSPQNIRLTTMQLKYPKFIHGEFMTHRVFSRNASSSRAIPVERLIQDVIDDPAMPVFWGKNRPGMQASEEMAISERETAINNWLLARDEAVRYARRLVFLGVHKQLVNRIIEPWCHIHVVVTSTEWENFFQLRCHKDAQPEMQALAHAMRDTQNLSEPKLLQPGQWHLPYANEEDQGQEWSPGHDPIRESVARCARVSYLTQEGKKPTLNEDLALYARLITSIPLHASPAEHQATPDIWIGNIPGASDWMYQKQHANFVGWRQYRKMLPNESVADR